MLAVLCTVVSAVGQQQHLGQESDVKICQFHLSERTECSTQSDCEKRNVQDWGVSLNGKPAACQQKSAFCAVAVISGRL